MIEVFGARVHNLKNIDVSIPHNQLVIMTGLSGSGKSSLAFDTIYAEGQRRYMETFSAYARNFIGNMERPDVDEIVGLSPVISIEQKSVNNNPRSTVGTVTEIYDFMRLLYAKVSDAYSYNTGEKMVRYSEQRIVEMLNEQYDGRLISIFAPVVKGRKGHYRELMESLRKQGYTKVRVDGEMVEITPNVQFDRYKVHDIEVVIDRLKISNDVAHRIVSSVRNALKMGGGVMMVMCDSKIQYFSKMLMCPTTGIAYSEPEPNVFSFNSPYGACPNCNGLGEVSEISIDKVIPDNSLSIREGGIAPVGDLKSGSWIAQQLEAIGIKYGFTLDTPISEIAEEAISVILYGEAESYKVQKKTNGIITTYTIDFDGIINFITRQIEDSSSSSIMKWAGNFMNKKVCPVCGGKRLKRESLHFKIGGMSIADLAAMDLVDFAEWLDNIEDKIDEKRRVISYEILRELKTRTQFLLDVGLGYLSLNRSSRTLSGGESQRIRLATQIGSQLVGILYILDEPSIGLHNRDTQRLIKSLKGLRDLGNSVIVVEHDRDIMLASDYIIDIGPGAGRKGGHIVGQGTVEEFLKCDTVTAKYLRGDLEINTNRDRRKGSGKKIVLKGATGNNLKNVTLEIPLGTFTCVTGVSGSGKSSLINNTLYPILSQHFYNSTKNPLPYKSIKGIENIDKVIDIDQSPIGRTPRSNPATYTKVFDDIRALYAELPESKIRGYKAGRFSFNVKGGRCEECKGAGVRVIEMNFLPDVLVPCEACGGHRYNRETLEVRFKGKTIDDVLNMTINQSVEFFENVPHIVNKLRVLQSVGIGYVKLGQQATTLSGGEAQRVKLATELAKRDTGSTMYILDEPTTGLHFEDVRVLLDVLNRLVDRGNTIVVIEHNSDVIDSADYVIEVGPDGGSGGGQIVRTGIPEAK